MIRQTPYSKDNEPKNKSEHSANRALPPSGEPGGGSGAFFISRAPLPLLSKYFYLSSASCLSYMDFSFTFLPSKPKSLARLKKTLLLPMTSTPSFAIPSIPPGFLSALALFFSMETRTSPSCFFLSSGSL